MGELSTHIHMYSAPCALSVSAPPAHIIQLSQCKGQYRRTSFNCECLIANCEYILLQSQSALLLYTCMRKPYANTMHAKMLERTYMYIVYFATQLKPPTVCYAIRSAYFC